MIEYIEIDGKTRTVAFLAAATIAGGTVAVVAAGAVHPTAAGERKFGRSAWRVQEKINT